MLRSDWVTALQLGRIIRAANGSPGSLVLQWGSLRQHWTNCVCVENWCHPGLAQWQELPGLLRQPPAGLQWKGVAAGGRNDARRVLIQWKGSNRQYLVVLAALPDRDYVSGSLRDACAEPIPGECFLNYAWNMLVHCPSSTHPLVVRTPQRVLGTAHCSRFFSSYRGTSGLPFCCTGVVCAASGW